MTSSTLEGHAGNREVWGASPPRKIWCYQLTSEVFGPQMLLVSHKYKVESSHYWGNLHTPHYRWTGKDIWLFPSWYYVHFLLELLIGTLQVILCYCVPNVEVTHWNAWNMHGHEVIIWANCRKFPQFLASSVLLVTFCFPSCDSTFTMCWHPYACTPLAMAQGFPWQPLKLVLIHHWNMVWGRVHWSSDKAGCEWQNAGCTLASSTCLAWLLIHSTDSTASSLFDCQA